MLTATTITANGGAVLFWRNAMTGERAVACQRLLLLQPYRGARWQLTTRDPAEMTRDRGWRVDAAIPAQAAVTRTNREARRA
jgi:hypothetical protein